MRRLKHRHKHKELQITVKKRDRGIKSSFCSFYFIAGTLKTLTLIFFYYLFSIGLTFYNRHLFMESKLALFATMCHLVIKFVVASLARLLLEYKTKTPRVVLDWNTYIRHVAPAGLASSLDIGLSNWSFEMITVSLYTMSKSTAVVFILFFSLVFRLEKFRWSLVVVVLLIFSGLMMFTYHSTQFNTTGFILVMTASVLAGLRWTLAQVLLQKDQIGLHNPLDMMYHIQPWMMVALLPLCVGVEGLFVSTTELYFRFSDWSALMSNIGAVVFGGCLGFMLELSEYLLLAHTSSLTLSISGVFKESCILALGYLVNHDRLNFFNMLGLVLCLLGITVHVITSALMGRRKLQRKVNRRAASIEILTKRKQVESDDSDSDKVTLFHRDHNR
ncbi:unnamed protein product [Candidula unifasciata]|uniref:Sugar phosphate transporter domain-containing protein n=1 Tax=Candidula unifasciata TaxID=100452 RepID=A0A8S3ZHE7_9EUPU|nr:unnamed protein product [Candidula unifasciata]